MADTDVYRVMYKLTYGPDVWCQERNSNHNKSGLWSDLSSAKRAMGQLNGGGVMLRKVQQLITRNGIRDGQVGPVLEWVDVDA